MGWEGNELTADIMGFWMGQQEKASAATLASSMYSNTRPQRGHSPEAKKISKYEMRALAPLFKNIFFATNFFISFDRDDALHIAHSGEEGNQTE